MRKRINTVMERAKSIFIISQKGRDALPEKLKRSRESLELIRAATRGIRIERIGVILKAIFLLRRINDRRKLYPSIITITTAYPIIPIRGISIQTRITDRSESEILTHMENTCSPIPLSIESVTWSRYIMGTTKARVDM